jgi:hypothetical protein
MDEDTDSDDSYTTESEEYDLWEADYGEGLEEVLGVHDRFLDESSDNSDEDYIEQAPVEQDEDMGDKDPNSASTKDPETSSTLVGLLQMYGDARCTDPRDKVYALLSLVSHDDVARDYINVDYSKTLLEFVSSLLKVLLCSSPESDTFTTFEKIHCLQQWFSNHIEEADAQSYLQRRAIPHLPAPDDAEEGLLRHLPRLTITHWIYLLDENSSAHLDDVNWCSEQPLKVRWPQYHFGLLVPETVIANSGSRSNTGKLSNQDLAEAVIEGCQSRKQNVVYAFRRWIFPPYEEISNQWEPALIAGNDVLPGDVVASISWPPPAPGVDISTTKETSAYAILRRRKGSKLFDLRSWAKPYRFQETSPLADVAERFPTRLDIGGLHLHPEDVLSLMLLNTVSSSSNWLDLAAVKMARGSYASLAGYELDTMSNWVYRLEAIKKTDVEIWKRDWIDQDWSKAF